METLSAKNLCDTSEKGLRASENSAEVPEVSQDSVNTRPFRVRRAPQRLNLCGNKWSGRGSYQ